MRILMLFAVGFAASCGFCAYAVPPEKYLFLSFGMVPAFLGLILGKRYRMVRIISVILIGISLGAVWCHLFCGSYLRIARQYHRRVCEAVLTASDYGYKTDYGYSTDGKIQLDGKEYKVRIYYDEELTVKPGDTLSGEFRFRYTEPKEGERTSHYQGKGIFLIADQRGPIHIQSPERLSLRYYPSVLAQRIREILLDIFPEDVAPFVKALLLGDGSDLSYSIDTDLKISGIRHVVAVSGLHVSLLYSLIEQITRRRRFLTAIIGLPALLLFAAVAGFSPSVSRACLMVALMMLSRLFRKEYDSLTSLAFACLVMLLINPLMITSVSLQLSAGCVAGIILLQPMIRNWILEHIRSDEKDKAKWKGRLASSVSVTLSAMVFTTPLSALYFGTVSLVAILTNLLTLWVISIVFSGIIISCGLFLLSPFLAGCLAWLLAWPIRYVLFMARLLSRVPLAAVYTDSVYIICWLVVCYVLILVFFVMRKKQVKVLLCCMAATLCLALACSWAEPVMASCTVTVLDVGQGQSILLQSGGKTFLVDCGGERDESAADTIVHRLYAQGIRRLDGVILTHCDSDHAGALQYVLERVETDLLFLPATEALYDIPEIDGHVIWVDRETRVTFGDCVMRIYPPVFTVDDNENSLCILFDTEKCDILITGDRSGKGERMLLKYYDVPDVDVLIAGHHGSGKATSMELLRAVQPETVIISVGKNNVYGHPADETLDRLAHLGCAVYRTDVSGTIIYRR